MNSFRPALVFSVSTLFALLSSCGSQYDYSVTPRDPMADYEIEVARFNEAYGDSIVFTDSWTYHMIHKNGSAISNPMIPWNAEDVCWSPRKWKIYTIAYEGSARGVFVMNTDGSERTRITSLLEDVIDVACSPDAKMIAYTVSGENGFGKIRVARSDGGNPKDVTGFFGANTFHNVTWSNDSRRIAFDGFDATVEHPTGGIGVVNADGTGFKLFFATLEQAWEPNWSPDGNKIVYVSFGTNTGNAYPNIFYYDIPSKRIYQATRTRTVDGAPHWSPDSKQIIFTSKSSYGSSSRLFLVNPDGSGLVQLSDQSTDIKHPDW